MPYINKNDDKHDITLPKYFSDVNKSGEEEINKMQFDILQNKSKNIAIKTSSHIKHEYETLLNIIKNEPIDESWSKFNFCERINKRDENGAFIFSNSQRKNLMLEYDKKVNDFLITLAS